MDSRTGDRQYNDIEPTVNWAHEDRFDTLLVHLPGFRKEQLRIQITSAGILRVTGERQVSGHKWNRFRKEMPVASNYDSTKVSAKFDNGILHVKLPKIIVPAEPRREAKPAVQPSKPPEPTPAAEPQKMGPKQDIKEAEPKKSTEEEEKPKEVEEESKREPAKPTEEDKKPKKSTEDEGKPREVKEESKRADEAKNRQETALQQKSDDLAEKDQKRGNAADTGKKMGKRGTQKASDIGQPKENVENLVTKLKKPRNLMNAMVAVLLIVVLGLYVKHAFRSFGTKESDQEL